MVFLMQNGCGSWGLRKTTSPPRKGQEEGEKLQAPDDSVHCGKGIIKRLISCLSTVVERVAESLIMASSVLGEH